MNISLNNYILHIDSDYSEIIVKASSEPYAKEVLSRKSGDWKWLLTLIEPMPIANTRNFIIERGMYKLFYKNILIEDILDHFSLIGDIYNTSFSPEQKKSIGFSLSKDINASKLSAENVSPHILGGAAITATFFALDDFIIQREMYKRRRDYIRMHIDIGKPSIYTVNMAVLSYVSEESSGYTISEFNGTFLPFGQAHKRAQSVIIGKDASLLVRLVYLYLSDQKEFCDWFWDIGNLSKDIKKLVDIIEEYNKAKNSIQEVDTLPIEYSEDPSRDEDIPCLEDSYIGFNLDEQPGTYYTPVLSITELHRILPSMKDLDKEERIEVCSWYKSEYDIRYMHSIYPESRELLPHTEISDNVLKRLCINQEYSYDTVSKDITNIIYTPKSSWRSLLEMQTKEIDIVKGAILTDQLDFLDKIKPTLEIREMVSAILPFIKGDKLIRIKRWLYSPISSVLDISVPDIAPLSLASYSQDFLTIK